MLLKIVMGFVVFWGLHLAHRFPRMCYVLHDFQPKEKKKNQGKNPSSTVWGRWQFMSAAC